MTLFHHRRPGLGRLLAGAGAATFVIAAAAVPTAFAADAAPVIGSPKVLPSPGFAATGIHTDACDPTTAPGWIGTATATLGVTVQAPAGTSAQVHFQARDTSVSPAVQLLHSEVPVQADGTARVQATGLTDGHGYAWHASVAATGGTVATDPCHFRVDLTPPSVSVTSTDFPASGSGVTPPKFAGQSGTFTIAGSDPVPAGGAASGVACYLYALAPATLGVFTGCAAPNAVLAAADGSASIQLKPGNWGANTLAVQAVDNAGNVSQPFGYNFYAPLNPNPPKALGDVDNDGIPDIVLPDAAGNLQVISGAAGSTVPSETVPAAQAPGGSGSWAGYEVIHRGWNPNSNPADTVFVRDLSTSVSRAALLMYGNSGSLDLSPQSAVTTARPTVCQDVSGTVISCPAGFTSDWSGADQLVALGPVTSADPYARSLVSVENGDLWLFEGSRFGSRFKDARRLTTSGTWTGLDLIAPGPDAKGNQALWARDRATGQLHVYPLPLTAAGTVDFSALADPTSGVVASGFTTAAYPTLGSSGDLNGDGVADLWAVTADRHLVTFDGYTAPKDLGVLK